MKNRLFFKPKLFPYLIKYCLSKGFTDEILFGKSFLSFMHNFETKVLLETKEKNGFQVGLKLIVVSFIK